MVRVIGLAATMSTSEPALRDGIQEPEGACSGSSRARRRSTRSTARSPLEPVRHCLRKTEEFRKKCRYTSDMSLAEVVDDLLELEDVGRDVDDRQRRRLDQIRRHLAERDPGAKVSEAASILGVSQPTVRSWIDAGILPLIPRAKPVRVDVLALADLKRAVDLVRANLDDRQLLVHVMRRLRDEAALDGADEGIEDYRAGRTVPLGDDLKAEIASLKRETGRRSKSR